MSPQHEEEYRAGLRMARPPAPELLEAERAQLRRLASRAWPERSLGYLKLVGPGYMQSAMTLGGGTAAASLFAGAVFGYRLLWVAPLAMLFGILMLSAVSHQTLSTGLRPFEAMRRFAGAPLAWAWALGALLSSIIWHFPQYSLASAVLCDMGDVLGFSDWKPEVVSFFVLAWSIAFSMLYGTSPRMVRWYERALKYMVWSIVLCFGLVVLRTGISDWGALWRGFLQPSIPGERNGTAGGVVVLSGLSAAVGVNMLFLYPYSLLARGWGREHRALARFDLLTGMFLPYALATSLMVIATANTIYLDGDFQARSLPPIEAARSLADVAGPTVGRVIFNLGVLSMALSSITLQMLTTGFVGVEWFGFAAGSWKYRLMCLVPIPGVLAPFFWKEMAVWVAVPTNIVCGLFLPAAYVGFILLQRKRAYLGDDLPRGPKGLAWISGMVVATAILTASLIWGVWTKGPDYVRQLVEGF